MNRFKKSVFVVALALILLGVGVYWFEVPIPFRYYTKGTNNGYIYRVDRFTGGVDVISSSGTLSKGDLKMILEKLETSYINDMVAFGQALSMDVKYRNEIVGMKDTNSSQFAQLIREWSSSSRILTTLSARLKNNTFLVDDRLGDAKTIAKNVALYATDVSEGVVIQSNWMKCVVDLTYPQPASSCVPGVSQKSKAEAISGNTSNYVNEIYSFINSLITLSRELSCKGCEVIVQRWGTQVWSK